MTSIQLITALLSIPFLTALYKVCISAKISVLPVLPILFITISMLGVSLFPFPNSLYVVFVNLILFAITGPLLALVFWRKKPHRGIWLCSLLSLGMMLIAVGIMANRPSIPMFVHEYFGLIQRGFYLGWTLWFVFLGVGFRRLEVNS